MRRIRRHWLPVVMMVALIALAAAAHAKPLADFEIFIEINDTDGDAGIQLFLDGEGWDRMVCKDPNGNKILDFRADSSVGIQGITELFFESAEPSFDEQPLDEFLALFPEGIYKCRGRTTEGKRLKGNTILTHALPDAPMLVFPNDESVDPDDAEFEWSAVADPPGSEIVNYQVIVDCEEPGTNFTADVEPDVTSIVVPPEILEDGEDCKWEVLAIEDSGNATLSEVEFTVD